MIGKLHRKKLRLQVRSARIGAAMQQIAFLLANKWMREESYRKERVHVSLALRLVPLYFQAKSNVAKVPEVRKRTHFRRKTRPDPVCLPHSHRVPEVCNSDRHDIIESFCNAAWDSGPAGLLRCRVAQRGLLSIFEMPRAGAILKYQLTSMFSLYTCLPGNVCSLCLSPDNVDIQEWERCFWCGDVTLCKRCVTSVCVNPTDPVVIDAPYYPFAGPEWGLTDRKQSVTLRACAICVSDLCSRRIQGHLRTVPSQGPR